MWTFIFSCCPVSCLGVGYRFHMISNPLADDLSDFLIHFLGPKQWCFDIWMKSVLPGCHSTFVAFVKQSAVQLRRAPAGGISMRTLWGNNYGEGHLDYKYWAFVGTIWELQFAPDDPLLTWQFSENPWGVDSRHWWWATQRLRERDLPTHQPWLPVPKQRAIATGNFTSVGSWKPALGWTQTFLRACSPEGLPIRKGYISY